MKSYQAYKEKFSYLCQGIQIPKIIERLVTLLCGMSEKHNNFIECLLRLKQSLGAERIWREFVMKKSNCLSLPSDLAGNAAQNCTTVGKLTSFSSKETMQVFETNLTLISSIWLSTAVVQLASV